MILTSPYHVDIPNEDILTFLFKRTKCKPDDTIWLDGEDPSSRISLASTKRLTCAISQGLRKFGVGASGPGKDIVLTIVENQIMVAPTLLGVLCAEGIHSTCSPLATAFELRRQMAMTKPKVLICSAQTKSTVEEALREGTIDSPIILEMKSGSMDVVDQRGSASICTEGQLAWTTVTDPKQLRETTACLIFSSGTTGVPKGVELSHANIVANLCQMAYHFGPRADKVRLEGRIPRMTALLQNSYAVGVLVHSMLSIHHGMEVVMMKKYTFEKLTEYARRFDLSMLFLAPPIYNRIVNEWKREDLAGIRWAMSGGSPMPLALQERVNNAFPDGTIVLPNWGMTELVCASTQFSPEELDEEGSVGRLVPGMEAIIVGANDKILSYNQTGELLVKGPNVLKGYYNNPEVTRAAFNADGWFRTGDVAHISPDGKVFIEGRYKELIKYKGNQVSPVELEGVINQCPGVLDVGVIGVRLEDGNELPRAYVVAGRESVFCKEEDVSAWVKTHLSSYKHLRGGVALVQEIPRNLNGKIMRDILGQWAKRDTSVVSPTSTVSAKL